MRKHRQRAILTATSVALGLAAGAPLSARAGSLLSGYGGPGQGNQAILGSSLIGGPSGGGATSGGSVGNTPASTAGGGAGALAAQGTTKSRTRSGGNTVGKHASGTASRPYASTSLPAATQSAAVDSQPLGLSGADLLYILLALAALALTGAITGRLVRRPR